MTGLNEKLKQHFLDLADNANHEYDYLLRHLPLVEKWAKKLILMHPEANEDVVLSGVWSHRCKDVQPETLGAKILAVADSASHMTDIAYIDMSNRGDIENAKGKLERDFRDTGIFPELQSSIKPLYIAWKNLLDVYPKEI